MNFRCIELLEQFCFLSASGQHALLLNELDWVSNTILLKLERVFVQTSPKLELLIKQPMNAAVMLIFFLIPRDSIWRIQSGAVAEGLNSQKQPLIHHLIT